MVKFNKQKTRSAALLATLQNPGTIYFPSDSDTIIVNNREYGKTATTTLYNRKGVVATVSALPANPDLYDVYTVAAEGKDYMYAPVYTIGITGHQIGTVGAKQVKAFKYGSSTATEYIYAIVTGTGDNPYLMKYCNS